MPAEEERTPEPSPAPSGGEDRGRAPRARAAWGAAVALLLVLPVWLADPLPLQDLPSHEQVVAALVNGPEWTGFGDRLRLDPTPRPYAVTYFAWALLARLVGVEAASRLLLTWALAGGLLAGAALVRALDPRKEVRALLVGLLAFSEPYYLGFVPFFVALPTGLWLLARRARRAGPAGPRALAGDAGLLLATYLLHPFAGLLAGLALLPFALAPPDRRRRAREVLVAAAPCLAWTLAVWALGRERPLYPDYGLAWDLRGPLRFVGAFPLNALGSTDFWAGGGAPRALALGQLAAWGIGLAALAWPGPPAGRRWRAGLGAALVGAGVFLFAFPFAWRNGSLLSVRVVFLAGPLLLAAWPVRREGAPARGLATAAVVLAAAVGLAAHLLAAREVRTIRPVLAAMEPGAAVWPPGPVSSRVLRGPKLVLLRHAAARYHARAGGLGPGGHLRFSTSPVEVTDPLPDRAGPAYRYVVRLAGRAPPPGFEPVAVRGAGPWRLYERAAPPPEDP